MQRWVVAFLSLHDGEIKQYVVDAESKLLAYKSALDSEFGRDYVSDTATHDDVEEMVYDSDCYISAVKI